MVANVLDKKALENFESLREETKKLVYYASHKFTASKKDPAVDIDDMCQNSLQKLWRICNLYKDSPRAQLLKIYKKSIWNEVAYKFRISNLEKNRGYNISIDSTIDDNDKSSDNYMTLLGSKIVDEYKNKRFHYLNNVDIKKDFLEYLQKFEEDKAVIKIYEQIAFPSDKFIRFCNKIYKGKKKREILNLNTLSKFFNIKVQKVYSMIKILSKHFNDYKAAESRE